MVGSGPYQFNADERVVGALAVYERFADYVPRAGGTAEWTAGPKIVHFDRVEWHVIPDASDRATALQTGEVDWWENPPQRHAAAAAAIRRSVAKVEDPDRADGLHAAEPLVPPFNNPAIRRALFNAIDQYDFMTAAAGDDPSMWHVPTGFFCPGQPDGDRRRPGCVQRQARLRRREARRSSRRPAIKGEKSSFCPRPISRC